MKDLDKLLAALEPEDRDEVRKYVRELREESAGYRVERNEIREKYTEAGSLLQDANGKLDEFKKLQDDHEALLGDNSKLNERLGRMEAAGKAGIFTEADRLKGATPEEWEADAAELATRFGGQKKVLPKDPAAEAPPAGEPQDDPLMKAVRDAGLI